MSGQMFAEVEKRRKEIGITLEELSARTDIPVTSLSRFLHGSGAPTGTQIDAIISALGGKLTVTWG